MIWLILGSVLASFVALTLFLYHYRKGQFSGEDVKYQMFRDEEK